MSRQVINQGQSLEDYAYNALRQMIVDGTLQPGAQLVQEDLATKLGVSRTPLRRAIANLERDNFIYTKPRGEAFVLAFGPNEIASIFEVRAVLEGLICRLIAPTIKSKDILYLRSLIADSAEHLSSDEDERAAYRQADIEFHSHLSKLAENAMLLRLLDSFQVMGLSFAQGLLRQPEETLGEHLAILDALEARDRDRAEQAMIAHIRKTVSHLASNQDKLELEGAADMP